MYVWNQIMNDFVISRWQNNNFLNIEVLVIQDYAINVDSEREFKRIVRLGPKGIRLIDMPVKWQDYTIGKQDCIA